MLNKNMVPRLTDSLDAYVNYVGNIPILSKEEEIACAIAYRTMNDLKSAQKLILSHLRFVVHVAKGYKGYGLPLIDLIQEGNIGLMEAVKRFNPEEGVRLITYSVYWIKGRIHEYIMNNWRMIKVGGSHAKRKLFYNLRKFKKGASKYLTQADIKTIARTLKVDPKDVIEMEKRMYGRDMSMSVYDNENDDTPLSKQTLEIVNLEAPDADPLQAIEAESSLNETDKRVHEALTILDERSRDIVTQRYLQADKVPFKDLAMKYKVSMERVRQIEANALAKMRQAYTA